MMIIITIIEIILNNLLFIIERYIVHTTYKLCYMDTWLTTLFIIIHYINYINYL